MVAASIAAGYALGLSGLQPEGHRLSGAVACAILLAGCFATVALRGRAYSVLRRHPWAILLPALAVGSGALMTGRENQQLFYVITLVMGVTGLAVPFARLLAATVVAALGAQLPILLAGDIAVSSTAAAALTVPTIFWLIIDRLARYILRTNELTDPRPIGEPVAPEARSASTPQREPQRRRLPVPLRRRELPARASEPAPGSQVLTARQLQVVLLCAEGLNHLQIAACLQVGPQQVRRHLRQAREATGSRTSAELVAWALRTRLIPTVAP